MNFEKIKKLYEINNYYWKERRILWNSIFLILIFTLLASGIFVSQHIEFDIHAFFLLYLAVSVVILITCSNLTFLQIENYLQNNKNTPFKKFLEKTIEVELYLRDKYIIRILAIILNLFILVTIINLIPIPAKSIFMFYLLSIIALILASQIEYLIYDLIFILKKIVKNKK